MKTNPQIQFQALNNTFRRLKTNREAVDRFKTQLLLLLDSVNDKGTEEFHKNLLIEFLKETYYNLKDKPKHFINTKGRNDLVIHNGETAKTSVGVIIEVKKPTNTAEMPTLDNLNVKAFHELILYYLRERIRHKNLEIRHLIITNVYDWFVFDVQEIERVFAQNKNFVKQFQDFEEGRLADSRTDFFYKQIAEPFVANLQEELTFTYCNLKQFESFARVNSLDNDKKLLDLYKLFTPEHLLKLPFVNDSNTLDRGFYNELLHIMGLTEVKDGGKKLIQRKQEKDRDAGSILEQTIAHLQGLGKMNRLPNPAAYGTTYQEQLFAVALELSITWINRILFLKLLEAQLLSYHRGDKAYNFLTADNFSCASNLDVLFFQVLARKPHERSAELQSRFANVPYLNSSLFEVSELEHLTLVIGNLSTDIELPILPQTVLKDYKGNRKIGTLKTLDYLFAFLDAYDFGTEGNGEIQEDNKPLITASVLGLVFEKINGYKDGSFFTPGFITMYMCRETLRRAVIQKFNEVKQWNCKSIEELYENIKDRKEASNIVNSIKICDPAVGSGHFLVSVLNELIAIKQELKLLIDKNGKILRDIIIKVENDELKVTYDDGEPFIYRPKGVESSRIQETLFREKQTIIENCLFGVDINPNSVKICRLRLWIELLKNAYYTEESGYKHLETLPNLDINIKVGNSLISRFALDADLKQALKRSKWTVETYRNAITTYFRTTDREQKREIEKLIADIKADFRAEISKNDSRLVRKRKLEGEMYMLTNQVVAFETEKEKKEKAKKIDKLTQELASVEAEIAEMQSNRIFENAFEWRFEFPEVLNEDGDFVGFDVVVGNPPYGVVFNYKIPSTQEYDIFTDSSEAFMLLSKKISKVDSFCSIILPKSILFANAWINSRKLLLTNTIYNLVDTGLSFAEVDLETIIYVMQHKQMPEKHFVQLHNFYPVKKYVEKKILENLGEVAQSVLAESEILTVTHISPSIKNIFEKIRKQTFLKDFERQVFRGLYIPDDYKENYLDKGNYLYINKVPDVSRYHIDLVRNIDLSSLPKFPTEKITKLSQDRVIVKVLRGARLQAAFCSKNILSTEKLINLIVENVDLYYTLAIVNSRLVSFYFNKIVFSDTTETSRVMDDIYLSKIPFPLLNIQQQQPFIELVTKILTLKSENAEADTKPLETEIDNLVYELYDLTAEEIKIVEQG
jgi:hypothetical protein